METREYKSFCGETVIVFSELNNYLEEMMKLIDGHRLDKLLQLQSTPVLEETFWWKNAEWRVEKFWPLTLNYSFVIMLFVNIETRLNHTCNILYERDSLPLQVKEIRGGSIEKCILYLDRFENLEHNKISSWSQIDAINKIRDCIVHTSGKIENSRDEKYLQNLIKRYPKQINLSDSHFGMEKVLILESDYCRSLCISSRKFFEDVFRKTNLADIDWPNKLA